MSVVLVTAAVALLTSIYAVVTLLRENYPPPRTSARQRLVERNPMLNVDRDLRWTVAARRVHVGRLATVLVGLALLLVTRFNATSDAPTAG